YLIMNASFSGVTASAARTRSPSFSRSSSSTSTTGRPALSSARSSGTEARPAVPRGSNAGGGAAFVAAGSCSTMRRLPQGEDPLDVLGEHVGLDVHGVARSQAGKRRDRQRVRDQRDVEVGGRPVGARAAGAA